MSREVLLYVISSAIELPDAMTTQTSPITIEGTAATRPARQPARSETAALAPGDRDMAGKSSEVEEVLTTMAVLGDDSLGRRTTRGTDVELCRARVHEG
jgi:hypothetical protein